MFLNGNSRRSWYQNSQPFHCISLQLHTWCDNLTWMFANWQIQIRDSFPWHFKNFKLYSNSLNYAIIQTFPKSKPLTSINIASAYPNSLFPCYILRGSILILFVVIVLVIMHVLLNFFGGYCLRRFIFICEWKIISILIIVYQLQWSGLWLIFWSCSPFLAPIARTCS